MNTRLLDYLRSLGLASDASDGDAWEFHSGLRGIQRSIANALNYNEADTQARTNCDLMIRSLGYNPEQPSELLEVERSDATPPADGDGQRSQPGTDGASVGGDLEAVRQTAVSDYRRDERQRQAAIRDLAEIAGTPDELVRSLIEDDQIELETARTRIRDEHRQRTRSNVSPDMPSAGPAVHSRNSQTEFTRASLACALMLREGISDPMRTWTDYNQVQGSMRRRDRSSDADLERHVDRGHQLSALPVIEIVRRCLEADGIRAEMTAESIGYAIQQRGSAAMSTSTLSGVFSQSISAVLLEGFERAPDTTEGWVRHRDVPNFLQQERTRIEKSTALQKLGKGGTAEHVTISEAQEVYKIFRYAGQFVVDDQDLVNDTLGALNDAAPDEMGESAADLMPDLAYALLLANANMRDGVALFNAAHGNLGALALNVANLEAVRAKMRKQTENGKNLNIVPRYLIVPADLESTAETLVESNIVVTGSDVIRGNVNSNSKAGLTVRADARLDNGVTDPDSGTVYAGSATKWFLSAGAGSHTIEVGHLRGTNRMPTMRTKILDGGQFGIGFDIKRDIGAKALSWHGLQQGNS